MKTIELEDPIYFALLRRSIHFGETPSDVIKRLLNEPKLDEKSAEFQQLPVSSAPKHPLLQLIESPSFSVKNGEEKYFDVIRVLYQISPSNFDKVDGSHRGKRVDIARDVNRIEKSGKNTKPKELSGTPYFVLTNLDHRSKRRVLNKIMPILNIPQNIISIVVQSIADSDITRSKTKNNRSRINFDHLAI